MRTRISLISALLLAAGSVIFSTPANAAAKTDLAVTVDAPATVYEGSGFTFFVTVSNRGRISSNPGTLTITFTGTSGPQPAYGCVAEPGKLVCPIGALPSGGGVAMPFEVSRADTLGTITITAQIANDQPDSAPENNTATDSTEVVTGGPADLSADASLPGNLLVGQEINFFLPTFNDGPATARSVTYTVTVSSNLEILGTSAGCTSDAATIVCEFESFMSHTGRFVQIRLRANSPGQATLTTDIRSTDNPDPDPSDNSDTATGEVSFGEADLAVSVQGPSALTDGQTANYQIGFQNNGPASAPETVLTVTVASGLEVVSGGGCAHDTTTVTCRLGELDAGGPGAAFLVGVRAVSPGPTAITAEISSDRQDSNNSNNSASQSVDVSTSADLGVTLGESADPVKSQRDLVLTNTVTNVGPSPVAAATLRDSFTNDSLQGLVVVSVTSSQGTCSTSTGAVVCELGALARGGSATVTVTVRARGSGTVTTQAQVTAAEPDSDPLNNTAIESTRVTTSGH